MPPKDKANINLLKSSHLPFKIVIFLLQMTWELISKSYKKLSSQM